jgi:phosphatidylinositol glycan class V
VGSAALLVRMCANISWALLNLCRHVGLFRYWTLSNFPLFLLAMPCLIILLISSRWAWKYPTSSLSSIPENKQSRRAFDRGSLIRLAMPQAVLALAAFTTYHVQIINRLSSGYPLWYIWLASMIAVPTEQLQADLIRERKTTQWMVRVVVIYAIVQGGLFASFLPPA